MDMQRASRLLVEDVSKPEMGLKPDSQTDKCIAEGKVHDSKQTEPGEYGPHANDKNLMTDCLTYFLCSLYFLSQLPANVPVT